MRCALLRLLALPVVLAAAAPSAFAQLEPAPSSPAYVRAGDTLATIAERYNLTIVELLTLNPGFGYGQLVEGTPIKLARSPVAPLLPERPDPARLSGSPQPPRRFDQSLDELVRQGVISPSDRALVRSSGDPAPLDVGAFEQACRGGALSPRECNSGIGLRWGRYSSSPPAPATKPLSSREQALLDQIRSAPVSSWRRYGQCQYDWGGWKLHGNGVRTTAADCGGTALRWVIAVSCPRLMVATRSRDGKWNQWEPPAGPDSKFRQGEDEMVAALCANISN